MFIDAVQVKRLTIRSTVICFTWDGSQTDWSKCLDFYELALDLYQEYMCFFFYSHCICHPVVLQHCIPGVIYCVPFC